MNAPVIGDYRDRSTGLTVFGVLEILFGAMCWMLVPMTVFLMMAPRRSAPATPAMLGPALGFYGAAGTVCIWLGIGSILARRWARALWVCLSGFGLATGVLASPLMVYMAFVYMPRALAAASPAPPPAVALFVAQAAMLGTMVLFYLVIPGVLFWFYTRPNVKKTCEARDPRERWTDRCPLPVLALSLVAALSGLMMFGLAPVFPAFPAFGGFVEGGGAKALMAGCGVLLFGLAWGLYRLRLAALWTWLVLLVVWSCSGVMTFRNGDLAGLYLRLGFDPLVARQTGLIWRDLWWVMPVYLVPWLAYGVYVRRYFHKAQPPPAV